MRTVPSSISTSFEPDVAARGGKGGAGGMTWSSAAACFSGAEPASPCCCVAGLRLEPHGEHRALHDHALGIDLAAEQLAEADIEREPGHFQIGRRPGSRDRRSSTSVSTICGLGMSRSEVEPLTVSSRPVCSLTRAATRSRTAVGRDEQVEGDEREHQKRRRRPPPILSSSFIRIRLNPPRELTKVAAMSCRERAPPLPVYVGAEADDVNGREPLGHDAG